jgi:hypothetical protein
LEWEVAETAEEIICETCKELDYEKIDTVAGRAEKGEREAL